MPDFWTHILGGRQMIEETEEEGLISLRDKHNLLYNFACQGPDFLYYHKTWPALEAKKGHEIAKMMHTRQTKEMLLKIIELLDDRSAKESLREKQLIYLSGFVAHFTLDRVMHPFVRELIGEDDRFHKILELKIDNFLVEEYWGTYSSVFSPLKAVDIGKDLPEFIEKCYRQVLREVFDYNNDFDFVQASYHQFKKAKKIYHSPFHIKYMFIKILNKFVKSDLVRYSHLESKRYHFLSEEDYNKIDEVFNQAVRDGADLFNAIFQYNQGEIKKYKLAEKIPEVDFGGRQSS